MCVYEIENYPTPRVNICVPYASPKTFT